MLIPLNAYVSETRYLHHDRLGSVDTVTNESGAVVQRLKYQPFGQRRYANAVEEIPSAMSVATKEGFTGHEMDDEVGLINMRGRMYDAAVGRFLSPDPIVSNPLSGQSFNPYSYARNSPHGYVDPSGLFPEELVGPVVGYLVTGIITYAFSGTFTFGGSLDIGGAGLVPTTSIRTTDDGGVTHPSDVLQLSRSGYNTGALSGASMSPLGIGAIWSEPSPHGLDAQVRPSAEKDAIVAAFHRYLETETRLGNRYDTWGPMEDFLSGVSTAAAACAGVAGAEWGHVKACGEQATEMNEIMKDLALRNFTVLQEPVMGWDSYYGLAHQWVLVASRADDVVMVLDPFKGTIVEHAYYPGWDAPVSSDGSLLGDMQHWFRLDWHYFLEGPDTEWFVTYDHRAWK